MQYFDWDRFEAEQGDEEAAEQGGAAGGEQGGEGRGVKSVSVSIAVCGAWC